MSLHGLPVHQQCMPCRMLADHHQNFPLPSTLWAKLRSIYDMWSKFSLPWTCTWARTTTPSCRGKYSVSKWSQVIRLRWRPSLSVFNNHSTHNSCLLVPSVAFKAIPSFWAPPPSKYVHHAIQLYWYWWCLRLTIHNCETLAKFVLLTAIENQPPITVP